MLLDILRDGQQQRKQNDTRRYHGYIVTEVTQELYADRYVILQSDPKLYEHLSCFIIENVNKLLLR